MTLLNSQYPSLVYDIGSSTIQFGHSGDAQPLCSVPSYASHNALDNDVFRFGHEWHEGAMPNFEEKKMISDDGSLLDKDLLETFFDWTYQKCFFIDSADFPILVTQPSHLYAQPDSFSNWRKSICEITFEFAQHPMVCLEHDSVLASFAHSAHTGVVVDFGWSCLRTVPILNGKPLLKSMGIGNIGGSFLCQNLGNILANNGIEIQTLLDNSGVAPTESKIKCCQRYVLQDVIRSCLTFPPLSNVSYCIQGKQEINVTPGIQNLFSQIWTIQGSKNNNNKIPEYLSISINNNKTPADVRRQLWANIITSGGLSNLNGFKTELEKFARSRAPENYRATAKVLPPMHRITSGQNTVWTGGSILASLDTFPEFCITLAEWKEEGESVLQRKCI